MARFSNTSSYTLTENENATLNSLISAPVEGSSDLSTLSPNNYPTAGNSNPNPSNQMVFMNQKMSWWLQALNAGTVKYTPISNEVNWSYVPASDSLIHISINITNTLIPNRTLSVSRDAEKKETTIVFEPKFGLHRTDVHTM